MDILPVIRDLIESLPEAPPDIVQQRDAAGVDPRLINADPALKARQQHLQMLERQDYNRDMVKNERLGLGGTGEALALSILTPGEQVVKGIGYGLPQVPGPFGAIQHMARKVLPSRSGYAHGLETVGAGYAGILQGLNDKGLFGGTR